MLYLINFLQTNYLYIFYNCYKVLIRCSKHLLIEFCMIKKNWTSPIPMKIISYGALKIYKKLFITDFSEFLSIPML